MKDVFMTAVCTKDLAGYNVTNLWKTTYDLRGVERSTTTTFLETGGCRSQRPVWNPARGVLVHIHLSVQFGTNGTNQTKEWTRGRNPASKKLLVWSASLSRIQPSPWSFDRFHLSQNS
mmetsp:Transcript_97360/g.157003  ORF Transcript_97360/g.157003 Transcript_97360/m.157003 type:complete len:118 (-) Transcript_97360:1643-1996(-)